MVASAQLHSLYRQLNFEPGFLNEAHQHEHDDQIASVSLTAEQPMSPDRFVPWIEFVVQRFGSDILRMRGIVAMKGDDQRFVIQGVHMLVEGAHQRPWKSAEKRESRLVSIGRNLPRLLLREGFKACRA
jgi:G3E family GTPase